MPFPLAHHPLQKRGNHLPLLLLQSHRGDFLNLILKMRGPRRSLTSSTWTAAEFAAREWQIMLTNQSYRNIEIDFLLKILPDVAFAACQLRNDYRLRIFWDEKAR